MELVLNMIYCPEGILFFIYNFEIFLSCQFFHSSLKCGKQPLSLYDIV